MVIYSEIILKSDVRLETIFLQVLPKILLKGTHKRCITYVIRNIHPMKYWAVSG